MKILPRKKFQSFIDVDVLKEVCRVHITRRVESEASLADITIPNGSFKDIIWEKANPQNMSWNLLGKHFEIDFNKYIPNKFGSEDWPGNMSVSPMATIDNFRTENNFHSAFIPLAKIDGIIFPIPLSGKPQQDFLRKTQIEPRPKPVNGIIEVQGVLRIHHKPTLFNYWHVQFTMFDHEGDKFKNNISSSLIKKFLRDDILGRYAKATMKFENSDIPSHLFIKSIAS